MSIKEDVKFKGLQTNKLTPEQVQRANKALARAIALAQQMVKIRENKRGDVL